MVTLAGGLVLALLSIVVSTVMDGNSFGALIGPSSVVLVLFGTLGISMTGFDMNLMKRVPQGAIKAFTGNPPDADAAVTQLATLSDKARREGVLALEGELDNVEDPFIKLGVQLIVDGVDAEQIQETMEIDVASAAERHKGIIDFYDAATGTAPTMGMVGTVIGLINMLGNLSSPEQLGIGMSLALLTTLYGVLFANFMFAPIANKLRRLNAKELSVRDMMIDGILTIQGGASPRMLVERLETYLAPDERVGYQSRLGSGDVASVGGATAQAA